MKKILFILSFLMFPALMSISQNIKHISLTFDINDFRIQQDDDGNFEIWSNVYNTCYKSDTLLPALPYIGYNVLVRNTEKYSNHLSSNSKELVRNNVNLAHNPVAVPTDMLPAMNVRSNTNPYEQKKYPDTDVEYVGTNDCGDYRLLTFHVCPFEFDATTRSLYLKSHVDLDIHLSADSPTSIPGFTLTATMKDAIKKMVVNPEDMNMTPRTMSNSNDLTRQTGYEYVIVTSNQFKGEFQRLADWKSHKGIRSKVITVEEIDGNNVYIGSTRQERIKNALSQISGCTYVLLGGDTLNVPTCMCYIGFLEGTDSITPADSYYSCLGTMNWDSDGNGFYGEISDNVSLFPCLKVSRAPVSTDDDAQVFVDRIINYESAPDTTYWNNSILLCGTSIGFDSINVWYPYYVNEKSDTQIWSKMTYSEYIVPSDPELPKWEGDSTFFYDTYTTLPGGSTYDFTASNLQTELQKGYTFVDVLTHGTRYSWRMEGDTPFTYYDYTNARSLVNNGYTIITTYACKTNAFDYHTSYRKCLSQELINNSLSGILAYWGTSRSNFCYPKVTNQLTHGLKFNALTYRKLFRDKYRRMGNATTKVKREMMSLALGSYNMDRKVWMELNLMGDPEMPVYLSKPKAFQNVDIQFVNDSIYVETNSDGFDICLINQADSAEYYIARDIETSNATFGRHNGSFGVCITKPNYIPNSMVCDITYLQNKTFTGSKLYATKHIMIGSNVTNKVAQGAVVINSGSTTVNASQDVTITKDFEVKTGAEFIITN